MQKEKIKVLVAMSGGVDSTVCAYLLKKQGHQIGGVFFQMFADHDKQSQKVKKICDKLNVPFYLVDVSKYFKRDVIDYFISEYEKGRTPNPCVMCNPKIKFKHLFKTAKKHGYDMVATGHYARVACEVKTQNSKLKTTIKNLKLYQILKSNDKKKDQTYFLWQLKQNQLSKIIFPLGKYTKEEVKNIAKVNHLPVEKTESQDICFIKDGISKYLIKNAKKLTKSGKIVDLDGNVIGTHRGLCNYTVGQRKNLGGNLKFKISNLRFEKYRPPKVFVLKLDIRKNQLIVGEEKDLFSTNLSACKLNWIGKKEPKPGLLLSAKIRSTNNEANCKLKKISGNKIEIEFIKPIRAISPGQSVAFYLPSRQAGSKNQLLGGAIINE
jgi:tRNA-specific 2-thiouridylase